MAKHLTPSPVVTKPTWGQELLEKAKKIDAASEKIDGYSGWACAPLVEKKLGELTTKYGEEKARAFLKDALDLDSINWILRNRAIEKADAWIDAGYTRDKLIDMTKAVNNAVHLINDTANRCLVHDSYYGPELLKLARYEAWKLGDYATLCQGDSMTFFMFMDMVYFKLGNNPVDFTELLLLARTVPESAKLIFEGKTPEAKEWFARAKKSQVQTAAEITGFLDALVMILSHDGSVGIKAGSKFATDGRSVEVPTIVNRFPSKEENRRDYTLGSYHEAAHIIEGSFEISVFQAELEKLGYRLRNPAMVKQTDAYVEIETLKGEPLTDEEGEAKAFRTGRPRRFETADDLFGLFGEDKELAHKIHNIIEDRRIDDITIGKNPGVRVEYSENKEKHLQFREVPRVPGDAGDILEAFLQLAIVPLDPERLKERLADAQKRLSPLRGQKEAGQPYDTGALAKLERQERELQKLLERHATLIQIPEALELVKIAERGNTGADGTNAFNATIDVVLKFKQKYPDYKRYVKTFPTPLIEEDISALFKKKLKKARPGEPAIEVKAKFGEGKEKKPAGDDGDPGGSKGEKPPEEKMKYYYPEWDCKKQAFIYDPENAPTYGYTTVIEEGATKGTPQPSHPVMHEVIAMFQRLKPDAKTKVRGADEGEEIDPRLYVDYLVKKKAGLNPEPLFYVKLKRNKRSVATAMLVDCSGSTSGQVLKTELQSMRVLSSAVETVGDPFAVWAFNSDGKDNTHFYVIKDWQEPMGDRTVESNHANRDGAAIRHATEKLLERSEKKKILILLADGLPSDDGTHYGGTYAMEDTRHAVEEAIAKGVVVFCIAVRMREHEAYELSKIYGEGRVVAISDVSELPEILPKFYRQVTRL